MTDTFHLFARIRKRVKKSNFKPDHNEINKCVNEYKKRGGIIKKVEFCGDEFNQF